MFAVSWLKPSLTEGLYPRGWPMKHFCLFSQPASWQPPSNQQNQPLPQVRVLKFLALQLTIDSQVLVSTSHLKFLMKTLRNKSAYRRPSCVVLTCGMTLYFNLGDRHSKVFHTSLIRELCAWQGLIFELPTRPSVALSLHCCCTRYLGSTALAAIFMHCQLC